MKLNLRSTLEGYLKSLKESRRMNEGRRISARNDERFEEEHERKGRVIELDLAISEVNYMLKACE